MVRLTVLVSEVIKFLVPKIMGNFETSLETLLLSNRALVFSFSLHLFLSFFFLFSVSLSGCISFLFSTFALAYMRCKCWSGLCKHLPYYAPLVSAAHVRRRPLLYLHINRVLVFTAARLELQPIALFVTYFVFFLVKR
jgi:hypothetical protein